jgi:hypothetical protein
MVEKIGMSEKRAMEISGHKTRSCFERYHVVSLADIQESGAKMDKWMKEQRATTATAARKPNRVSKVTAPAKNRHVDGDSNRDAYAS